MLRKVDKLLYKLSNISTKSKNISILALLETRLWT